MTAPAWALREAPETVRLTWPEVTSWTWLSPLRLKGETDSRTVHLVVVDEYYVGTMGQAIPDYRADDPAYVAETFAKLRLKLMADIGMRVACQDGTPVRSDHSALFCRWCGRRWDAHEPNGAPDGPG